MDTFMCRVLDVRLWSIEHWWGVHHMEWRGNLGHVPVSRMQLMAATTVMVIAAGMVPVTLTCIGAQYHWPMLVLFVVVLARTVHVVMATARTL